MKTRTIILAILLIAMAFALTACGDYNSLYIGQCFPVPGESDAGSMFCIFGNCWCW